MPRIFLMLVILIFYKKVYIFTLFFHLIGMYYMNWDIIISIMKQHSFQIWLWEINKYLLFIYIVLLVKAFHAKGTMWRIAFKE